MPLFALFILALYIFLQSAAALQWFAIDAKLTAFVGILFVIVIIIEAFYYIRSHPSDWYKL